MRTRAPRRTIAGVFDAFTAKRAGENGATRAAPGAPTTRNESPSLAKTSDAIVKLERAMALVDVKASSSGARRAIMAGNWKMNPKTASEAATLAALVGACARDDTTPGAVKRACEVLVCPPAPFIAEVARIVSVEEVRARRGIWNGCENREAENRNARVVARMKINQYIVEN